MGSLGLVDRSIVLWKVTKQAFVVADKNYTVHIGTKCSQEDLVVNGMIPEAFRVVRVQKDDYFSLIHEQTNTVLCVKERGKVSTKEFDENSPLSDDCKFTFEFGDAFEEDEFCLKAKDGTFLQSNTTTAELSFRESSGKEANFRIQLIG